MKHPLYNTWSNMIYRCTSPKSAGYKNYGAKGISVCERWKDFNCFLADMGVRPEGYQLDRIDDKGNYEPENCRWLLSYKNNSRVKNNIVKRVNLTGKKFGRYLVIDVIPPRSHNERFLCQCDCGIKRAVNYLALMNGIERMCYNCSVEENNEAEKSEETKD